MPFFSPLWCRGPRIVFLHHVHAEMWRMVLPGWLARAGETVERRVAPPAYRRSRVGILSESAPRRDRRPARPTRAPRLGARAGHRAPVRAGCDRAVAGAARRRRRPARPG